MADTAAQGPTAQGPTAQGPTAQGLITINPYKPESIFSFYIAIVLLGKLSEAMKCFLMGIDAQCPLTEETEDGRINLLCLFPGFNLSYLNIFISIENGLKASINGSHVELIFELRDPSFIPYMERIIYLILHESEMIKPGEYGFNPGFTRFCLKSENKNQPLCLYGLPIFTYYGSQLSSLNELPASALQCLQYEHFNGWCRSIGRFEAGPCNIMVVVCEKIGTISIPDARRLVISTTTRQEPNGGRILEILHKFGKIVHVAYNEGFFIFYFEGPIKQEPSIEELIELHEFFHP